MDDNRIQIEEIKNRLDIVDQISKYLELKTTGKNYSGLCPFHTEKTPSFIVSPELQRFKCFGCGENGDIFNFIQKIEGIDFPEALEKLSKEAGVELKKPKLNSHIAKLYDINKLAARYYYKALKKDKNASAYIQNRGISEESIYKFGLGYSPGGFGLLDYLQGLSSKFSKNELIDSGLFTLKSGKLREKFFKRIMFPIRSTSGKVIGFSGRVLSGDHKGPKYINTPETPIYHKKDNVYGQYESRKAIRKNDLVIFCEGQTDVISAHQMGFENIVAPLGTALTIEQLKQLSKLTKNFLFLFDSDSAGLKAMERALLLISQLNLRAYGASPDPYKDIDELLQKDKRLFNNLLKNKLDLFSFLFLKRIENLNPSNYTDVTTTIKWVEDILSKIPSTSLKSIYIKSLSNSHFFDSAIIADIKRESLSNSSQKSSSKRPEVVNNSKSISRQEEFLSLLLIHDDITLSKDYELRFFTNPNIKSVLEFIKKKKKVSKKMLLNEDFKEYIEDAIFHFSEIDEKNDIQKLYILIKQDYYNEQEKILKKQIALAESRNNTKESEKLLEQFLKLTQEKKNEFNNS